MVGGLLQKKRIFKVSDHQPEQFSFSLTVVEKLEVLVVGVVEQEAVVLEGQQLVQLASFDSQVDMLGMVLLA